MSEQYQYDALNFDGLERRGNYRVITYREDILQAFDKRDAAAIIFQIVYRWQVEYKRPQVLKKIEERKKAGLAPYTEQEIEDMMSVYMSYNDFVRESGGAVGYNTVIRTLHYLTHDKQALIQTPNQDPKYPDFMYTVNKETLRNLLRVLPVDPMFVPKIPKKKGKSTQMGTPDHENTSTQMGTDSTQMGTDSTQMGTDSTQMGREVYPFGGTSQNHTDNTQDNTDEGKDTSSTHTSETSGIVVSASAENDAPFSLASLSLEDLQAELARRQAIPQDASVFPIATNTPDPEPVQELPEERGVPVGGAIRNGEEPPVQAPQTPARTRAPRGTGKQQDVTLNERINKVFHSLDKLARKYGNSPDFQWTRSARAKRYVKELLEGRTVTEKELGEVYKYMATMKPNPVTGFTWADKITIKAICENYDSISLHLAAPKVENNILPFRPPQSPQPPKYQHGVPTNDELRANTAGV